MIARIKPAGDTRKVHYYTYLRKYDFKIYEIAYLRTLKVEERK